MPITRKTASLSYIQCLKNELTLAINVSYIKERICRPVLVSVTVHAFALILIECFIYLHGQLRDGYQTIFVIPMHQQRMLSKEDECGIHSQYLNDNDNNNKNNNNNNNNNKAKTICQLQMSSNKC